MGCRMRVPSGPPKSGAKIDRPLTTWMSRSWADSDGSEESSPSRTGGHWTLHQVYLEMNAWPAPNSFTPSTNSKRARGLWTPGHRGAGSSQNPTISVEISLDC